MNKLALEAGAVEATAAEHWARGGPGAVDLANAVVRTCTSTPSTNFKFLYPLDTPLEEKIRTVAREIYGAKDIELSALAQERLALYTKQGFNNLPICMAKTHLSLTDKPEVKGAPKGFILPIRDVSASIGAGFIIPMVGTMAGILGLPTRPAFFDMDVNPDTEEVEGLF